MSKLNAIVTHGWYSSHIQFGEWATITVVGPFHRHRANMILTVCDLNAIHIISDEHVIDSSNITIM